MWKRSPCIESNPAMIKVRGKLPTALLVVALLALTPPARGDDGTPGADEAALREAGLGTDGPAVLIAKMTPRGP